jgi:hypothetical protein
MITHKKVDPIPEEFDSYEAAADFWDTHDTTDYPDAFETVEVEVELRRRRYEIEIEEDLIVILRERAQELGTTVDQLANEMIRERVTSGG